VTINELGRGGAPVTAFYIVEQIGDCTFRLPGSYETEGDAMLAVVTLSVACDDEREFFVDGPGMGAPKGVGPQRYRGN
jgi:hypothetical protein